MSENRMLDERAVEYGVLQVIYNSSHFGGRSRIVSVS